MYYVDLTLRDGIHLQEAIQVAKEIDQKSKLSGFNQAALDQMALQGYANAQLELDTEEGEETVNEFYVLEGKQKEQKQVPDLTQVQKIQKGLQQSVKTVN